MVDNYILNADGEPERCDDFLRWSEWMETHRDERIVAKDRDEARGAPNIEVSTIFMGLDHNWSGEGPPILWETMIFGGPLHLRRWRYASRAEALAGHQAACRELTATLAVRQES